VLAWLLLMCVLSTAMLMVNKHVVRSIPCPCLISCTQNAITVALNILAVKSGALEMKPWQISHLQKYMVQGVFFTATIGLSVAGLPKVATSTLIVFKSLTTMLTSCTEMCLGLAIFSRREHAALTASFLGSVLYASQDAYYDAAAYQLFLLVALVNCGLSTYERKVVLVVDQTPVGCSCYKNVISVPLLLIAAVMNDEFRIFFEVVYVTPVYIYMGLMVTTCFGFGLSLCYATLYRLTAATTVLVTSNVNRIVTAICGNHIFDEHTSPWAGVGVFVSLCGSLVYTFEKSKMDFLEPKAIGVIVAACCAVVLLVMS